jgi:uncharacterized protein
MTPAAQTGSGNEQEAVLTFLRKNNPDCKRIDTHASVVLLGSDRVLKIKRALRLPFLDYSTLEKRQQACKEELVVNRRFAPKLYRRVVPITLGENGLEIDGKGPAIEWAVEMSRFDENKTLDNLAREGDIAPELAEALAVTLRDTHLRAEKADGSTWLASISGIIDRNTEIFVAEAELPRAGVERLATRSHHALNRCRVLLRARASEGLVRRCHGDAHLGNIVLIDGKPVLFDAIEFDPVIATTDVLYDLAFPIMDFCHFGLAACASRLFNGYLQACWPENGSALRLLPLFLSMRAAIRSNVLFTKRRLSQEHDQDAKDALAYFDLALRHIEPTRPMMIAIGGKSGTGKSVLARQAATLLPPPPGAVVFRSDVIRKQLFGIAPLASLPEAAYSSEVTARVYRTLFDRSRQTLEQGLCVVVDAAFLKESERNELSKVAAQTGAEFRPVFLTTDLAIRLSRIRSRTNDASDATTEVAAGQEDYEIGKVDWPIVDASGSPAQTLERSRAFLARRFGSLHHFYP